MKKRSIQAWLIVALAIALCFASCSPKYGCYMPPEARASYHK